MKHCRIINYIPYVVLLICIIACMSVYVYEYEHVHVHDYGITETKATESIQTLVQCSERAAKRAGRLLSEVGIDNITEIYRSTGQPDEVITISTIGADYAVVFDQSGLILTIRNIASEEYIYQLAD